MGKVWHILKPNKCVSRPSHLIFYDTETTPKLVGPNKFLHKLRLGVLKYIRLERNFKIKTEKTIVFYRPEEFWNFLDSILSKKRKIYVFAHNQHFDFNVIAGFKLSQKHGYQLKKWVVDSNRFIIQFRKNSSTVVFLDTANYVRASLKMLGEAIGLKKLEIDFSKCRKEELVIYCKRDVEIIKRFIISFLKFLHEHDLGNFKYTIASQAFTAYRHRFMPCKIFIHAHEKAIKLERESYRGGRCEAFFIGVSVGPKIYKLDINSMYPYVMRNKVYPYILEGYKENITVKELKKLMMKYLVIADVEFFIDEPAIAVKKEKLIFPVGHLRAVLCHPELLYVLMRGKIYKVYRVAFYRHAALFTKYVDYFYNLKAKYKQEKNKVYYLITKLFLNSLYGKFGQKTEKWECIGECEDEEVKAERVFDADNKKWLYYVKLGNKIYKKCGEVESFDSFVAVASFVTAYARMYLWHIIKRAGLSNVYYCDTDSVFVNSHGYRNLLSLLSNEELGKLKLEDTTNFLIINGSKDYVFGDHVKVKGVKITSDEIKVKIANNKPIEVLQERFYKTRSLLLNSIDEGVIVEIYKKKLRRVYDKAIVLSNGRTKPFKF